MEKLILSVSVLMIIISLIFLIFLHRDYKIKIARNDATYEFRVALLDKIGEKTQYLIENELPVLPVYSIFESVSYDDMANSDKPFESFYSKEDWELMTVIPNVFESEFIN